MKEITIKFNPPYWNYILIVLFSTFLFSENIWYVILPFFLYFLFGILISINRKLKIEFMDGKFYFTEKSLLKNKSFILDNESIYRIWEFKYRINFIPMYSTLRYCDYSGNVFNICKILGFDGYLDDEEIKEIMTFMKTNNPKILFGY